LYDDEVVRAWASLPRRIYLATSTLQTVNDYGEVIWDGVALELAGRASRVRRAFAGVDLRALDPFVQMDQMGEVDYAPGEPKRTPWHPHRGFETVTY